MSDRDIVAALYDAVADDSALVSSLSMLAARYDCAAAVLAYFDPSRPGANVVLGHGVITPAVLERYNRDYSSIDPAPAAFARLAIGEITSTDRMFDVKFHQDSRFVNEFYHPLGLVESMGGPIANEDGRFGLIAVMRTPAREPFSDAEFDSLAQLVPTFSKVMALRRAFFANEVLAQNLSASIDSFPAAVMIFGRSATLSHANSFARTILARNDGLALDREGQLRALDRTADAALQRMMSRSGGIDRKGANGHGPGEALANVIMAVPRHRGALPYVLRLFAMATADGEKSGFSCFVSDPGRDFSSALPGLARALGLSDPVGRLVMALTAGIDLRTYAGQAGISYNTAKFHLKAAFLATGTQRQSDLIRVISAVIRDLALVE